MSIAVEAPRQTTGIFQKVFDSVLPATAISLVVYAKWTTVVRLLSSLSSGAPVDGGALWLQLAQELVTIGFFGLVVVLYVIRKTPLKRVQDLPTAILSIFGAWITTAIAVSPRTVDIPLVNGLASVLIVAGTGFALWGLLHLRRCFSILPEARGLVRSGPYRIVRHPLYVGEFIATAGMLLTTLSPITVAVCAVFAVLQLRRMMAEEKVLGTIFPEYEEYARQVPRLIPRIVP